VTAPSALPPLNVTYWLLQTAAMMVTAFLIPGLRVTSPLGALLAVVTLAFINAHLWDAALFFEVPRSMSIHTVLLLGANGLIFWLVVKLLPGIEISGIIPALVAPVVFTGCSLLVGEFGSQVDWPAVGKWIAARFGDVRGYFERSEQKPPASSRLNLPSAAFAYRNILRALLPA
jgi:putative membrane protein